MVPAPIALSTDRLQLRRPTVDDAASVFAYASDVEVTRFMGWPTHRTLEGTRSFLELAVREWTETGVGTYLVSRRGAVVGSTGLHLIAAHRASTGYILRRDAWGQGYATEACRAMVGIGRAVGFARIEAICHLEHHASARVLEKSGLAFEGVLRRHSMFPNLCGDAQGVRSYAWARPDADDGYSAPAMR